MSNFDRIVIIALTLLIGGLIFVAISYNGRINTISEKLDTHEAKIARLIEENTAVKEKLNKLNSSNNGQSNKIEGLQELAASINSLENKIEEMESKIASGDESWESELKRIEEKINELETYNKEQTSIIEVLKEETKNLKNSIETLNEKMLSSNQTREPSMNALQESYLSTDKFGSLRVLVINQGGTLSGLKEEVDKFSNFGNTVLSSPLKIGYVNTARAFNVFTNAVEYERKQVQKKTEELVKLREKVIQGKMLTEEYNKQSDILQAEKLRAQLAVNIAIVEKMKNSRGFESISDRLEELNNQVGPIMTELNKMVKDVKNGTVDTEKAHRTLNEIYNRYNQLESLLTQLIETKIFQVTTREAHNQGYDLVFLQKDVTSSKSWGKGDDLTEDIKTILRWELS